MAIVWSQIEWHDIRISPEDMPDEEEDVLVTVENLDGSRRTRANVFWKEAPNGDVIWYEHVWSQETHRYEDAILWYPVIAWAYYPDPYIR